MAYLAPFFKADAFVSYSQGDPRGQGEMPLKTWTLQLVAKLENEIRSIDPDFEDVHLFRDEQLDPTGRLTQDLREMVSQSCILMIVMSRYYLKSTWCKDELEWFSERLSEKGRIFIIRAQATEIERWPTILRDERGHAMLGFQFCAADAEIPYGWPDLRDQSEEFRRELSRLLTVLIRRLREFKEQYEHSAASPTKLVTPDENEPVRLFLHAPSQPVATRDALKDAVIAAGIGVQLVTLPDIGINEPDFGQRERRSRITQVKRCDAIAFMTGDSAHDMSDEDEFFRVCIDDRKEMTAFDGKTPPCVILDRSGGKLTFNPVDWGATKIDMTSNGWQEDLAVWAKRLHLRKAT